MKKWIIANWKMNKTIKEAEQFADTIIGLTAGIDDALVVCPTFLSIKPFADKVNGTHIKVGAQNCYKENNGAFTGELSPAMIKEAGAEFVILGHSERRHIFGETDELINEKIKAAINEGLKVIFCIGETLDEKANFEEVLLSQLEKGLKGVDANGENLIIAYEPVWAIGTGKVATIDDIKEVHSFVLTKAQKILGYYPPVLYGGSVKPSNSKEILDLDEVGGVLIGGASLDAESYEQIARRK